MTESEKVLWGGLRGKQLLGIQFYRQKSIGNYIVDFFAPKAKIVIEVDGSQHLSAVGLIRDKKRDEFLRGQGFLVLRFTDTDVLNQSEAVLNEIFRKIAERLDQKSPQPPFTKGGIS